MIFGRGLCIEILLLRYGLEFLILAPVYSSHVNSDFYDLAFLAGNFDDGPRVIFQPFTFTNGNGLYPAVRVNRQLP